MAIQIKTLRPFVGSKDFEQSRAFYRELGFEETVLEPKMSLFRKNGLGFYLQDAYVKDWLENLMLFMEVPSARQTYDALQALGLPEKFPGVNLIPTRTQPWGEVCYVLDPAGALLQFGNFR